MGSVDWRRNRNNNGWEREEGKEKSRGEDWEKYKKRIERLREDVEGK